MSSKDLYRPPNAALTNTMQPLKIGGWLRFFQFINYFGLITACLAVLLYFLAEAFIGDIFALPYDGPAMLFELVPAIVISYFIVKHLPKQSITTPTVIKKLLGYYLVAALIIGIIIYVAYKTGHVSDKPAPFISDLIYYAIWSSYFKRSKRVFEYYGAHAQ